MLAPKLKETKIQSHSDTCPRTRHLLTFDFSSSSKMAFLGLGGGRFSSLSADSSGSCLMIPDGQRGKERVPVASISWNRDIFRGLVSREAPFYLAFSASGRHPRSWPRQVTPQSSYRSAPEPSFLPALVSVSPGTDTEKHMRNTQHTPKKNSCLGSTAGLKATRTSYLGRNHFDELIEEAELPHFAVKPLATVFHTRFQNLEGKKLPKTRVNPAQSHNIH